MTERHTLVDAKMTNASYIDGDVQATNQGRMVEICRTKKSLNIESLVALLPTTFAALQSLGTRTHLETTNPNSNEMTKTMNARCFAKFQIPSITNARAILVEFTTKGRASETNPTTPFITNIIPNISSSATSVNGARMFGNSFSST
mmetsp:Transcript_11502/g.24238  ORF Transcript_11502/g.24238 Transcript_11502/m.24238 type:complete len:146 (+) Transcript_11502:620-1057(+)